MKTRTKNTIARLVKNAVISEKGIKESREKRKEILRAIVNLQPDKPDDGSTNFIAFDVPNKDKRMKLKTGRFLSRKLSLNSGFLNDQALQTLSDTINMELFGIIESDIKLVNGSDITDRYRRSFGSKSCMCNDCADYTKMYEYNPGRFQMLAMEFGNDQARAIVHKLDNGEYLMDRVYGSSDSICSSMEKFAVDSNWMYRRESCVYYNGSPIDDYDVCIVSDLDYAEGEVPFMDTLTSGRLENDRLTIFHRRSKGSSDYELESTCGNLAGGDTCYSCECGVHEDEVCWADDHCYCQDCYCERFSYCEECDEDVLQEDMVHIEDKQIYVCNDCAANNYTECEDCNAWTANAYYIEDDDKHVCEKCFEDYTGCEKCDKYFSSDDITRIDDVCVCSACKKEHYTQCAECDEFVENADTIENDNGDMVCDDCGTVEETPDQTYLYDDKHAKLRQGA